MVTHTHLLIRTMSGSHTLAAGIRRTSIPLWSLGSQAKRWSFHSCQRYQTSALSSSFTLFSEFKTKMMKSNEDETSRKQSETPRKWEIIPLHHFIMLFQFFSPSTINYTRCNFSVQLSVNNIWDIWIIMVHFA